MSWLDRSLDFFDRLQLIYNRNYNCKIKLNEKTSAKSLTTNRNTKILLAGRTDGDSVATNQKTMAVEMLLLEKI